jgi:hypothetical protein
MVVMRMWPNELFIDYVDALDRWPDLDLGNFAALWLAAQALAESAVDLGLEPEDIPNILLDCD